MLTQSTVTIDQGIKQRPIHLFLPHTIELCDPIPFIDIRLSEAIDR